MFPRRSGWMALALVWIVPVLAQDELQQARERFDNVATLAAAYLHSADSIEARLHEDGATLHPEIVALRNRIVAALNQAHDAIGRGSVRTADHAMGVAEALVEKLSKKLGG